MFGWSEARQCPEAQRRGDGNWRVGCLEGQRVGNNGTCRGLAKATGGSEGQKVRRSAITRGVDE